MSAYYLKSQRDSILDLSGCFISTIVKCVKMYTLCSSKPVRSTIPFSTTPSAAGCKQRVLKHVKI